MLRLMVLTHAHNLPKAKCFDPDQDAQTLQADLNRYCFQMPIIPFIDHGSIAIKQVVNNE